MGWWPSKKGEGHSWEGASESQEEGSHGNWVSWHPDLGFPSLQGVRKQISAVEVTQSVVFCYSIPSRLRQAPKLACEFWTEE